METTAKIAAKGCQSTGISEDLAEQAYDQLIGGNGVRKLVAVVELLPDAYSGKNGKHAVSYSILSIEPAPTTETEDHLRNLARAFHYERRLADGQLEIETGDDLEPKVSDVLAAGRALTPHPFLGVDPDGPDDDLDQCEICGSERADDIHEDDPAEEELDLEQGDEDPELEPAAAASTVPDPFVPA